VLKPYGDHCTVTGSAVSIRRETMTTFALFLHELATNSVKYGALHTDDGNVTLRWTANDKVLELTWIETGGPPATQSPERCGFGSEMVNRIVRAGGGAIHRTWRAEGLVVDLQLPNSVHI
jgi:two-component sensor histidine kinase